MSATRHTTNGNRTQAKATLAFMFCAGLSGAVIGFVAALAVLLPAIHTDLATQTKQLSDRLSSTLSAPMTLADSCSTPLTTNTSGQVLGISTSKPMEQPSSPTAPVGQTTTIIKKITGGFSAPTTATISDTGPKSTNEITTTNTNTTTVTNTNTVNATNVTTQSASSGAATVSDNTTGGAATSGAASNTVDSVFHVDIAN